MNNSQSACAVWQKLRQIQKRQPIEALALPDILPESLRLANAGAVVESILEDAAEGPLYFARFTLA